MNDIRRGIENKNKKGKKKDVMGFRTILYLEIYKIVLTSDRINIKKLFKKEIKRIASISISVPWAYKATVLTVRPRPLLLKCFQNIISNIIYN